MTEGLSLLPTLQLPAKFPPRTWQLLTFPSTLYLQPVLDVLLQSVPESERLGIHLGLQEALVNAARHGNQLDPSKSIAVRYARIRRDRCWIIRDEGSGFTPPAAPCDHWSDPIPCESGECGRGLYILFQVFDQVHWNPAGNQLALYKRFYPTQRLSLVASSF